MPHIQHGLRRCPQCQALLKVLLDVVKCRVCGYEKPLSESPEPYLWVPPSPHGPTLFENRIDSTTESAKTPIGLQPGSHKEPEVLSPEPVPSAELPRQGKRKGQSTAQFPFVRQKPGRRKSPITVVLDRTFSKHPQLTNAEMIRELDFSGVALPKRMQGKHETFKSAYLDRKYKNSLQSMISKSRRKMREKKPL